MEIPLQSLFQEIALAKDEIELKLPVMTKLGCYFRAKRWKLGFLDQLPTINDNTSNMVKLAMSLDHNPILRYLVARHAAVHEEVILPPGIWPTFCPRADHGHVMAGPIVSNAELVGVIALTRHKHDPAFDTDNLADLNALCLHLSTRLTALRSKTIALKPDSARLTPREAQIAELVAAGLTNAQIAANLWITENTVKQALKRIFRKLEVSSRTAMVAKIGRC